MGIAAWGPLLDDGTPAVTLYLELDLGVVSAGYQPNAVGVGTVGSLRVENDVTWTDLTHLITTAGLKVTGRFERATQNFTGWTITGSLRNDDGALSRHNSQSPYYLAGIGSTIKNAAPVRLRATYNNGATLREWTLFDGHLKAWDPSYEAAGYDPTIEFEAVDDFARLADFDGYEQTPAGAGESTGARINRVLDNAGHRGSRSIATGVHTVQATTLAQNALTEAKLTADSEGGTFYADPTGRIIFEDRDSLAELDRSINVQVTFADDGTPGALRYDADVRPRYDDRLFVTDVAYARVGGTVQAVSSTTARAQNRGIIVQDRRTDLVCETDPQALALARRTLALRKQARDRIDGLSFAPDGQFNPDSGDVDPDLQTAAWEAISSGRLCLLALVNTTYTPIQPGEVPILTDDGFPILTEDGEPITVDVSIDAFNELEHIQGITHTITPADWRVDLAFSSAEVWYGASRNRVGTARVGELVVWV